MIQIILKDSYSYKSYFCNEKFVISNFKDYKSFDLYEINIICLSSNDLWESNSLYGDYLNDKSDLLTLTDAIRTCHTKVVICFPQNHYFRYEYLKSSSKFNRAEQLKTMIPKVRQFIGEYIYTNIPNFNYEKGITKIDTECYESDFYFFAKEGLILCEKSKKVNTMKLSDIVVCTTLNLFDKASNKELEKRLLIFLNKINFLENSEPIPQWIEEISFYGDSDYIDNIEKCNEEIETIVQEIKLNKEKLDKNMQYKSILYSTGNTLAKQVNDMLIEMFELDSKFVDVFEEDFNFKFNDVTFLVETKGLNNEVTGKNVSDAYDHLVLYEDELEKQGKEEKTKCLFVVAPERMKNPSERAKIKERQITIAKRNKTLIIETTTFYNIFEDFIKGKISTNEIFDLFSQNVGLLEYSKKEE